MGGFDIDNSISSSDHDILNQFSTLFHLKSLKILTGKKHPKIKLQLLTKNTNIDIWVVGTSNYLFLNGSKTRTNFPNFVIGPFCSRHSNCLNVSFRCVVNLSGFN